jgi:Glyoxalase-like domain
MYTRIQVVFDAADPSKLADFWAVALGYVQESPPPGFATWADFARSIDLPEDKWGEQASLVDPEDAGPRLYFQRVPEGKVAKNRVHLDVRVARGLRGDEWKTRVEQHVARLIDAGGTIAWRTDTVTGRAVIMRDPEGNEFCVC